MDKELEQILKKVKELKDDAQAQDDLIIEYLKSHLDDYRLYDIYGIKDMLLDLSRY
jgi:hypothetical protein